MRLRTLLPLLAAALSVALLAIPFAATAEDEPPTFRAVMPNLSADSAEGFGLPAPGGTASPSATSTATATPTPPLNTCAGFRTPVRTLSDPAANFERTPRTATFFELVQLTRPDVSPSSARIAPTETEVVELSIWLRGYIRTNNGGINLVFSNNATGAHMFATFPAPGCTTGASPADQEAMNAARLTLISQCGMPTVSNLTAIAGPAKVRAVPTWGTPRTDGVNGAFNGIELGAILSFEMDESLPCDPAAYEHGIPTPTPIPTADSLTIGANGAISGNGFVNQGDEVIVVIYTQPPTPGISCYYLAWDNTPALMHEGAPQLTGPAGTITWSFIVPLTASVGIDGRITPYCKGMNARGSARITISPAP